MNPCRFVACAFVTIAVACSGPPDATLTSIAGWAARQGVARGSVESRHLPPEYAHVSKNGDALIARLRDGRTCALLYTSIGFKENFDAVLTCDAPIAPDDLRVQPDYHREYVTFPHAGAFEELYVRKKRSDRVYDVFFDLN